MFGAYTAIAGVLLYFLLLRSLDSEKMSPIKAALLWVAGYYGLSSLVMGIEYALRDIPVLVNLLDINRLIVAVIQFAVAVGIFCKVDEAGDDYMTYLFWGGLGLALIFFVAPQFALRLTGMF